MLETRDWVSKGLGQEGKLALPSFIDRIRCAFPVAGIWQWETECSDPANSGLHHQRGTVNVAPYEGTNTLHRHGFLKVSDDRRYLGGTSPT